VANDKLKCVRTYVEGVRLIQNAATNRCEKLIIDMIVGLMLQDQFDSSRPHIGSAKTTLVGPFKLRCNRPRRFVIVFFSCNCVLLQVPRVLFYPANKSKFFLLGWEQGRSVMKWGEEILQGVSLAIGPKVFLITFKVIDVI
jgi:hypothetical protein